MMSTSTPSHSSVPTLRVRVEQLPEDSGSLLDLAPMADGLACWVAPTEQFDSGSAWGTPTPTIVGWGQAARLEFAGSHAMRDAARQWDDLSANAQVTLGSSVVDPPQLTAPVALASFGFAASTPGCVVVPELALLREGDHVYALFASATELPELSPLPAVQAVSEPAGIWTTPGRMTQNQWLMAVRRLIRLLRAGAASKVVLARDLSVSSAVPIDQRFLAQRLRELYPTTFVYAVEGLIGATPELLASARGNRVTSRVLAGTSAPDRGRDLLDSLKNRSEHHFAVESVARALAPMAEDLNIPTEPSLLRLPNVTHLSTDISATVRDANVLDVIAALHPTAATCGTPTKLALDILEELEGTQRGRYSGPVGWVDGAGDGEFGIALRCGQLSPDRTQISVFAGGGIMPDSIPEVELAETRAKMKPVLQALGLEN